jgi:hypothetical protein
MRTTVVQEKDVQTVGEGLGEGVDEELEALGIEIRQCEEEPLAGRRRYGPVDLEPFKDVLHRANGPYPKGREVPSADRQ